MSKKEEFEEKLIEYSKQGKDLVNHRKKFWAWIEQYAQEAREKDIPSLLYDYRTLLKAKEAENVELKQQIKQLKEKV